MFLNELNRIKKSKLELESHNNSLILDINKLNSEINEN